MSDGDSVAIDVSGLGKRFGIRWVLRGVSFEVRRGEAVGLLGPNGSGKSTVLRILGTLLNPNAGTGSVNGLDIVRDASSVRGQVGYLAHTPALYDDLTARENLCFAADMLGLPRRRGDDFGVRRVQSRSAENPTRSGKPRERLTQQSGNPRGPWRRGEDGP